MMALMPLGLGSISMAIGFDSSKNANCSGEHSLLSPSAQMLSCAVEAIEVFFQEGALTVARFLQNLYR